jgi:hypothetical protein
MAWDQTRPVPWLRLVREWLLYAAIMAVVFVVFFRGGSLVGAFAGLFASGPLYVALGALLAKLGYQRKTLRELRAERTARGASTAGGEPAPEQPRPRPAPTRRTSGGGRGKRPASRRR